MICYLIIFFPGVIYMATSNELIEEFISSNTTQIELEANDITTKENVFTEISGNWNSTNISFTSPYTLNTSTYTEIALVDNDVSDFCNETICVRKCCPRGMFKSFQCQPLQDGMKDWAPGTFNFSILYGSPPNPNPNSVCVRYDISEVKLVENGTVIFKPRNLILTTDYYCFDNAISEDNETFILAGICIEPIKYTPLERTMMNVKQITISISCICLFILIVIHISYPKMRSKMHEKCFLSMCFALFAGMISLLFIQGEYIRHFGYGTCVMLGISVQYFMISFNFWLNVRCFETLRIIRGTVKAIPISLMNSSKNRWLKYSLCCWGIPLFISTTTVIMQMLPEGVFDNFRPNIGNGMCFLAENVLTLGLYYYGYQVILHVLNLCYLTICFYLLFKTGEMRCCKDKKKNNNLIRSYNKKSLNMFWQQFFIFLVYVIILSLDSASLIKSRIVFWNAIDVLNTLQGVYLFVLFLISSKSRRELVVNFYKMTSSVVTTLSSTISNPMRSWKS